MCVFSGGYGGVYVLVCDMYTIIQGTGFKRGGSFVVMKGCTWMGQAGVLNVCDFSCSYI